jgi:hypothetical protein
LGRGTRERGGAPTAQKDGQRPAALPEETMPKATKTGRQVARFEDGELWCGDDAAPPASPAGWYFRPGGGASVPWVGPFPTAEAAEAAPCGGDPVAAARRRLAEWARAAKAEAGPGAGAEEDRSEAAAGGPAAESGPGRLDPLAVPPRAAGTRRPARSDALAGASVEHDEAPALATARTLAPAPGPSPRRRGRVAVGGLGSESEDAGAPRAMPSAPRQLAFGFGRGAEAAAVEHGSEIPPRGHQRAPTRRKRASVGQGALPF